MKMVKSTMRIEMLSVSTHVRYDCHGQVSQAALVELIGMIRNESKQSHTKILVDLSRLDGDLDVMERYVLGTEIAANLMGRRIAVVSEKHKINKVSENTAVNRGANMLVTHDEAEAVEWLLRY
jgi:hypothetical protein